MASFDSYRLVARAAWLLPAFLLFIALQQTKAAYDLRRTLTTGEDAVAEVTKVHQENRVDVTYDYVNLRVPLSDGRVLEKDHLSLPHTLITMIEGKQTVDVKVRPADGQVVITEVAATQWHIAALNAVMSGVAALLFAGGVFAWNRYLRREGDPSQRLGAEEDAHPAGKQVRIEG